jgi:uncharacterized protein involved in type VI secretion and phage assembly
MTDVNLAIHAAAALRAQLAHFTQNTRLLRLTTPLGANAQLVERIEGHEALSEGYRFVIEPWTAFLRHHRDCYVWQDKSVLYIAQG